MELFTNTSHERFAAIAENYVNSIFEDRGSSNVEDLVSAFVNAGFTKSEFLQALDKRLLESYEWEEEPAINTETGEGVFWKEYTENEDAKSVNPEEVNIGDSDQAILETALTQIGIEYEFHKANGDNWIEILTPCDYSVEFLFNDKGDFLEVSC